ncbi:MAG: hypothetical protein KAT11_02900 [Phycisphaerae bacterium]|nr:hypothetical protein [Phycisphaerae bacterium]
MNWSVLDIGFLVSLLILALIPKKRWLWLLFGIVLSVNIGIRVYYIHNSHVLRRELEQTKQLAQPPILSLSAVQLDAQAKNPTMLLKFSPSKNQPLGALSFVITIVDPDSAKIISVARRNLTTGDSKNVSHDGKTARISFTPLGAQPPILVIEVSGPCKIHIQGNHIPAPIELELKRQMPNKMSGGNVQ